MGLGPNGMATYREHLDKGFAAHRWPAPATAEIFTGLTIQITDDVRAAIEVSR
jgi:hypothetical protein